MAEQIKGKTKPPTARQTPARKKRRSREEGKRLLLEAADKLLLSYHPDKISIRDIAAKAHVHHRFITEWFGGKAGLFREVHTANRQTIARLIDTSSGFGDQSGLTLETIRHQVVLVNWLVANGSKFKDFEDAFPALEPAREFLIKNFKLQGEDVNKSVQIIGAIIVADALLQPYLKMGYTPVELFSHHLRIFNTQNK